MQKLIIIEVNHHREILIACQFILINGTAERILDTLFPKKVIKQCSPFVVAVSLKRSGKSQTIGEPIIETSRIRTGSKIVCLIDHE